MKLTPFMKVILTAILSVACVLGGCQSPNAKPGGGGGAVEGTQNNCYSLLHQLLEDQKGVSLLRFIKREPDDLKKLVKRIAEASGTGAKLLEEFAKHDPSINLKELGLPPGETVTRAAIASTKKKELLGEKGDTFELSLLLAQAEALGYAWHLAKVAAENEIQPERARAVTALSEEMRKLHGEVFALLLSKAKSER